MREEAHNVGSAARMTARAANVRDMSLFSQAVSEEVGSPFYTTYFVRAPSKMEVVRLHHQNGC